MLTTQGQYSLARAQQSFKSLVQIHEKNGKCSNFEFSFSLIGSDNEGTVMTAMAHSVVVTINLFDCAESCAD